MRLSKIKLVGFKSFVDPTNLYFRSSLACVAGPNGCGKSNIIDAIKWVFGEGSPSALRAEAGTDVIFNGSQTRKPAQQASVELLFEGTEGKLQGPYAQSDNIAIKRLIQRDGLSQYFINQQRVRRKDVHDLFLGTGLGSRSYSIIGQGTISQVIEAKPQDLRAFIEEAAQVSKYKERRKEAESHLKKAEENLARVHDRYQDQAKNLEQLKKQYEAAKTYQRLQYQALSLQAALHDHKAADLAQHYKTNEQKITDLRLALEQLQADYAQAKAAYAKGRETIEKLRNEEQAAFQELATLEARQKACQQEQGFIQAQEQKRHEALHSLSQTLSQLDVNYNQSQTALSEVAHAQEKAEQEVQHATQSVQKLSAQALHAQSEMQATEKEYAACKQELSRLQNEIKWQSDSLAQHYKNQEQLREETSAIIERLKAMNIADIAQQLERLEADKEQSNQAKTQAYDTYQAAKKVLHQAESDAFEAAQTHKQAEKQLAHKQGQKDSLLNLQAKTLASASGQKQLPLESPILAQQLRIAPTEYAQAIDALFAPYLSAACLDTFADKASILASMPTDSIAIEVKTQNTQPDIPDTIPLSELLHTPALPFNLEAIYLVETIEIALEKRHLLPNNAAFLCKNGFLCTSSALIGPEALLKGQGMDGLLQRQVALEELEAQIAVLSAEEKNSGLVWQEKRALCDEAKAFLETTHTTFKEKETAYHQLASSYQNLKQRHTLLQEEEKRLQRQQQAKANQSAELEAKIQTLLAHKAANEKKQAQRQEQLPTLEALCTERQHKAHGLVQHADDAKIHEKEKQLTALRLREQHSALEQQIALIAKNKESHLQQQQRLQQTEHAEKCAHLSQEEKTLLEKIEALKTSHQQLQTQRLAAEEKYKGEEKACQELQQQEMRLENSLEKKQVEQNYLKENQKTLIEEVQRSREEKTRLEQCDYFATLIAPEDPFVFPEDKKAMEKLMADLQQQLKNCGPVNLPALSEYPEQAEALAMVHSEMTDAQNASQLLLEAMQAIDAETKDRFMHTFEQVNAAFSRLFPNLFGGGEAALTLDSSNVLEAGIILEARPPGKKNNSIHLLSGGEKALSAIAFVFAIFSLNPAPFCLLDEVDAPLDERNVQRYTDMLAQFSEAVQFIFISHNKVAMEAAEELMGVTMKEPGVSRVVSVRLKDAVSTENTSEMVV